MIKSDFARHVAQRAQQLPPFCLDEKRKRLAPHAFAEDGKMSLNKRIGFMGAGQMAEALARGLIDKGVVQASQICCSDPAAARKELFRSLGATPYDTNLEVTAAVAAARLHCCCPCHTAVQPSSTGKAVANPQNVTPANCRQIMVWREL